MAFLNKCAKMRLNEWTLIPLTTFYILVYIFVYWNLLVALFSVTFRFDACWWWVEAANKVSYSICYCATSSQMCANLHRRWMLLLEKDFIFNTRILKIVVLQSYFFMSCNKKFLSFLGYHFFIFTHFFQIWNVSLKFG